jgi:thiol-disulfide isomerase/thioredoxin
MKLGKVFLSLAFIVLFVQALSAQTANNNSSIKINVKNGKYTVSGRLTDENTKSEIVGKIKNQLGDTADFSALKVDSAAEPFAADWRKNFDKSLLKLKNWKSGVFIFTADPTADTYPNAPDEILNARIFPLDSRIPVRIADYRNRTVVLFFLASWCSPCVQQADVLQELYPEVSSSGVEIIGVNADSDDNVQFKKFVRLRNYSYKMAEANENLYAAALKISKFAGIPQAFLIRDGKLYAVFTGNSPQVVKKLKEKILEVSKTR